MSLKDMPYSELMQVTDRGLEVLGNSHRVSWARRRFAPEYKAEKGHHALVVAKLDRDVNLRASLFGFGLKTTLSVVIGVAVATPAVVPLVALTVGLAARELVKAVHQYRNSTPERVAEADRKVREAVKESKRIEREEPLSKWVEFLDPDACMESHVEDRAAEGAVMTRAEIIAAERDRTAADLAAHRDLVVTMADYVLALVDHPDAPKQRSLQAQFPARDLAQLRQKRAELGDDPTFAALDGIVGRTFNTFRQVQADVRTAEQARSMADSTFAARMRNPSPRATFNPEL